METSKISLGLPVIVGEFNLYPLKFGDFLFMQAEGVSLPFNDETGSYAGTATHLATALMIAKFGYISVSGLSEQSIGAEIQKQAAELARGKNADEFAAWLFSQTCPPWTKKAEDGIDPVSYPATDLVLEYFQAAREILGLDYISAMNAPVALVIRSWATLGEQKGWFEVYQPHPWKVLENA